MVKIFACGSFGYSFLPVSLFHPVLNCNVLVVYESVGGVGRETFPEQAREEVQANARVRTTGVESSPREVVNDVLPILAL